MNVSELRIGNYVFNKNQDRQDQITGIFNEFISVKGNDIDDDFKYMVQLSNLLDYELNDIKPIPLTEEWILKLGGERKSQYGVGVGVYHIIVFDKLILLKNIKDELYACNCAFSPVIKYVHQLQNLYFSLTQTELTIKDL